MNAANAGARVGPRRGRVPPLRQRSTSRGAFRAKRPASPPAPRCSCSAQSVQHSIRCGQGDPPTLAIAPTSAAAGAQGATGCRPDPAQVDYQIAAILEDSFEVRPRKTAAGPAAWTSKSAESTYSRRRSGNRAIPGPRGPGPPIRSGGPPSLGGPPIIGGPGGRGGPGCAEALSLSRVNKARLIATATVIRVLMVMSLHSFF